ncbi:MAG: hypothetical protein QQN41_08530 [Nitrosopumilus sp.]
MSTTFSENGIALTETIDDVTMPVDFSFEKVNGFVHSTETHFEELQALCLGMSSEIDRLNNLINTK